MTKTPSPEPHAERRPMSVAKARNYTSERGASAYYHDHRTRLHRRMSDWKERKILQGFLEKVGRVDRILDLPCGYGRFLELFAENSGTVVEADFSPTMLALNASLHGQHAAEYLACSALAIPLQDRRVDAAVSIRLSHHLDHESDREDHVRELCRVADDAVIFTFFSRTSLKNRLRRLRARWSGKREKNTLEPGQVARVLDECGFAVVEMTPLSRLSSGHVYTLARRKTAAR